MKKYHLKLASVLLFFATNAAIGMRPLDPNIDVYVLNKATGLGGKQYTISIKGEPNLMASIGKYGHDMRTEQKVDFGKSAYVGKLRNIADILTSGDYASGWTSNKRHIK